MIDLHCHILPGIDDGAATPAEALAIAQAAQAAGTSMIVATPHVSWRYPNEPATIALLAAELGEQLAAAGVAVEVKAGAEVAITRVSDLSSKDLKSLHLGDGPWLLLEPPFTPVVTGLELVVADLQREGHMILLAHPERCPAFQRDPRTLHALVAAGVLTSITASSLTGRFGKQVQRFSMRMVREDLVHNVTSDAHDAYRRSPAIAAHLQRAGLTDLTEWLTRAVPEAILNGGEIPPRPTTAASRARRAPRVRLWRRQRGEQY